MKPACSRMRFLIEDPYVDEEQVVEDIYSEVWGCRSSEGGAAFALEQGS